MAERVGTDEVRRLVEKGAQVVEVLPASDYEAEHLPGACNVPLPEMTAVAVARAGLDAGRATVVYCYDHECDLSARGATRLESLGFSDVYDYVASKVAWMAEGLPVDGTVPASSRAGAIAQDVAVCGLDNRVSDLESRFGGDDGVCVVVDEHRVVLGVVRQETLDLPGNTPVAQLIQPGPPSVRPSITARELAKSMDSDSRTYVLVTTPHGELLGLIRRSDLHGEH
jgi:rhodanese-related sulfurtransferase